MKIKSSLLTFVILSSLIMLRCAGVQQNQSGDSTSDEAGFVSMFNGKDFTGWEGNLEFFSIKDEIIIAGSLENPIPRNEFLCTQREYSDFEMRLQVKVNSTSGRENGGIQIRSQRVPNHNEVSGYQADIGIQPTRNIWGGLYDESRRNEMLDLGDQDGLNKVWSADQWTDYTIRCEGKRIQIWINGFQTVDYYEEDPKIEDTGIIGLQIHSSKEPSEIWYKNIRIKELNTKSSSADDIRDPSTALANLDLYPGLEASLVASEPTILSPTNLDVDHKGRIWVCEVVNYRAHALENKRPEGDRILILEDNDGDGEADTVKVYYQGRDIDAALGISVLGNKVIVTVAPNVIVFTDEDGDDVPDRKEYLFTETGIEQNDHSTHSFLFGPDGKLYWNMGNAGFFVHDKDGNQVLDRWGNGVYAKGTSRASEGRGLPYNYLDEETSYYGGMVFRNNMDGSDFEVLAHNFRNNYEVTVDSYGNMWQSDNDDDGNAGVRMNYILEYGNYGYRDEITGAGWQEPRTGWSNEIPKRHWHQNDPGVIPNVVLSGAGSPAGITFYEGRLLPEPLWDKAFHADAGPGVLWAINDKMVGAGYEGEMVNILKGERDKWMRPVDVSVAPDGSLFVTDWYDPVLGWNRQEDSGRGRLFRVAPIAHKYSVPEFDFSTAKGATEALKNPNYSVRYLAWTALNDMQEEAEGELLKLYRSSDSRYRARSLWLLSKIQGKGEKHIQTASKDSDENIRVVSIRAARQIDMDMIPLLKALVSDPSPRVRRECAIAIRESNSDLAPQLWNELAQLHDGEDRWYLEALGVAAEGRWDSFLSVWLKDVGDDWNSEAGKDIIWRSRAKVTPSYLKEILNSSKISVSDSKRYVRALDFQPESEEKTNILRDLVLSSPRDEAVEKNTFVATEALLRLENFDINQNSTVQESINSLMKNAVGTEQFAQLVRKYNLTEYYDALMTMALENKDNLVGLYAIQVLFDAEEQDVFGSFLSSDIETALKTADALGNSRDRRSVPILVTALMDEGLDRQVRAQTVRALVLTRGGAEKLLELARNGEFPERLEKVAGQSMANSMHVIMREEASKYFPMPPMKGDQVLPGMTELLVYVGDSDNGKKVFDSASCSQCHIINGKGVNFGPNLSKIGDKLSKEGLYKSILDPSAGISSSYKQFLLELEDGDQVTGFIVSETSEKMTVRSEGGIVTDYSLSDIRDRYELPNSAMPADLQLLMSVDELVDLVEYLTVLK
jgi:putative membrane-bound dehydrogenase-like protein